MSTSGNPAARATLAVVIIPGTPPATSGATASQTLVTVAQELNLAGNGTVVAGPVGGSGPGSAIDVLRSGGRADHFSSVDDADTTHWPDRRGPGPLRADDRLVRQLRGAGQRRRLARARPPPRHRPRRRPRPPGSQRARNGPPGHPHTRTPARQRVRGEAGSQAAARRRERHRPGPGGRGGPGRVRAAAGPAPGWRRPGPWQRNHRGEPVTLLEGPAAAAGAALAAALTPSLAGRDRAALITAAAGAAAFGGYDDLAGSGDRRGFRGHLGVLGHGEVTTGAIKIGGIGATGVAASGLLGGAPLDVAVNAGLIAGGANLLNLFDLRPGRAIKVAALAGGLLAATRRPGTAGNGPVTAGPVMAGPVMAGPVMAGPVMAGPGPGAVLAGIPLGAGLALAGEDLGERAMLGDAGANALGPRTRRGRRGEPAAVRPGGGAGRDHRADRGQREGQLHQGHPADSAAALAGHARPPARQRPGHRGQPGPGQVGAESPDPAAHQPAAPGTTASPP